jgi:hypothetical protein
MPSPARAWIRCAARSLAYQPTCGCYVGSAAPGNTTFLEQTAGRRGTSFATPMTPGARTPEELETLFEDAFVVRDGEALSRLFEDGAVLVVGDGRQEARGEQEIARSAVELWDRQCTYLADPRRVLQARDTALVVAEQGVNVMRRGSDGAWRYAIALLSWDDTTTKEER